MGSSSSSVASGATWTGGITSGVNTDAVAMVVAGFEPGVAVDVVVVVVADDHQSFFSMKVSFLSD